MKVVGVVAALCVVLAAAGCGKKQAVPAAGENGSTSSSQAIKGQPGSAGAGLNPNYQGPGDGGVGSKGGQ